MSALAAAFTYASLVMLALAMRQHARTVFNREFPARTQTRIRRTGWILLTLSLATTFNAHGGEIGVVAWAATLAVSGFALTVLLTYAPRCSAIPFFCLLLAAFF